MSHFPTRRRWRVLCAFVTAAAATVVAAPASEAQEPAFPNGPWIGFLSMDASATFFTPVGDVEARYVVQGGFDVTSRAGNLEGEWALYVDTYLTASDGFQTEGAAIGVGPVLGLDSSADLELDLVTASSGGVEFTFTADELPTPGAGMLTVERASCDAVSGSWDINFNGQPLVGTFTALPASGNAAEDGRNAEALTGFAERGQALLDEVQTGTVDEGNLRALFAEADGITSSALGPSACGGDDDRSSHRSAAPELINSILFELSSDPGALSTRSLIEFIVGGYRSGFFDGDDGAEALWLGEYERRVAEALAGDDAQEVRRLASASEQLGRTEEARSLWERYEVLDR